MEKLTQEAVLTAVKTAVYMKDKRMVTVLSALLAAVTVCCVLLALLYFWPEPAGTNRPEPDYIPEQPINEGQEQPDLTQISAQYPDNLIFVPVTNPDIWEVELHNRPDRYTGLGSPYAWLDVKIDGTDMVITSGGAYINYWPRLRTKILSYDDPAVEPVLLDTAETPYLHYDFDYDGPGQWMIMLILDRFRHMWLANEITVQNGLPALADTNFSAAMENGNPGRYKGVIDLNEFSQKYGDNNNGFRVNRQYNITSMHIVVINPNVHTKMTIRELRISDNPL
jgi:hypothetical protein